jgi:hypothetical protein
LATVKTCLVPSRLISSSVSSRMVPIIPVNLTGRDLSSFGNLESMILGTAVSALYNIPFQLSQKPPVEWADYFPRAWDHPSSWRAGGSFS